MKMFTEKDFRRVEHADAMERLAKQQEAARKALGDKWCCYAQQPKRNRSVHIPVAVSGSPRASVNPQEGGIPHPCAGQGKPLPAPTIEVEYGPPPVPDNVIPWTRAEFRRRLKVVDEIIKHAEGLKW